MKDNRFIELVNLYVDRQISPAETAELEADIQANPRHRKIYQQYCHMHCATKQVYESFRANAEQPSGAVAQRGGSVAQFEYSRQKTQRVRWYYSIAGMAAAACFALVVARTGTFSHTAKSMDVVKAQAVPSATASSPVAAAQSTMPASPTENEKAAALSEQRYAAQLSAKRQEEMRAYALSQQRATQPITLFADGAFDEKLILTAESKKIFQLKRKSENSASTEFTAFQFQR